LFSNSNGTGLLFSDANVALVSGVATSTGYTATATGTDYWVATYNGNSNNASVTSGAALEPVSITPATPSIITTQQPASATVDTPIADKATVSGGDNPTGTVTFNLYSNSTGIGTPLYTDANVPLSGGVATSTGYTAAEPVTVTPACPTISTCPSPSVVPQGTATRLTDTATLSGGYHPTGTITFTLVYQSTTKYTQTDAVTGNGTYTASYSLSSSAPSGFYQWNATYNSGNSNNNSASDNNDPNEQVAVVNSCCNLTGISFSLTPQQGETVS